MFYLKGAGNIVKLEKLLIACLTQGLATMNLGPPKSTEPKTVLPIINN